MALITMVSWIDAPLWDAVFIDLVARRRITEPATQLGVATGWSSTKDFFDEPGLWPLTTFIRTVLVHRLALTAYDISGWANVMRQGDVVREHDHDRSHLGGHNRYAGTYFVGARPDHAPLVVAGEDPITPSRGLLVLFDADTPHHVLPHTGSTPRVSLAFNVRLTMP
jgi:hypothetical protein